MSVASIFTDLEALRLSVDDPSFPGTREVLSHVPVRRPNRHEFVRVHPDQAMSLATAVYTNKEDRETFLVAPEMRHILVGELRPTLLATTITRQGALLLWPLSLPADGRRNDWHETARQAAELAKTAWIRLVADMGLGAYRIYKAEGHLAEPEWPDIALTKLLEIAFHDRVISSTEHPEIRRLKGLA